jgi:hypothetical protein
MQVRAVLDLDDFGLRLNEFPELALDMVFNLELLLPAFLRCSADPGRECLGIWRGRDAGSRRRRVRFEPAPLELVRSFSVGVQRVVWSRLETVVCAGGEDAAVANPVGTWHRVKRRGETGQVESAVAVVTKNNAMLFTASA